MDQLAVHLHSDIIGRANSKTMVRRTTVWYYQKREQIIPGCTSSLPSSVRIALGWWFRDNGEFVDTSLLMQSIWLDVRFRFRPDFEIAGPL